MLEEEENYASKVRLATIHKVGLTTIQSWTLYYLQDPLLVASGQGLAYRNCEALTGAALIQNHCF